MPIVLTRIDDRLIHGQIVLKWSRHVGATHIVVTDEEASKDFMLKSLMKSATPSGMKSIVLSVKDAAELLNGPNLAKAKTLVVLKDPKTVVDLIDNGVEIDSVNVGNMRYEEGKKKITNSTFISEEDVKYFKELTARNVKLIAQWLPGEETTDLNKMFKND